MFGQTKVSDFDMPININKDVLWLDVSVDYVLLVEILQTKEDLSEVELSECFRELLEVVQMEENFSTCADVHDEEEFFL